MASPAEQGQLLGEHFVENREFLKLLEPGQIQKKPMKTLWYTPVFGPGKRTGHDRPTQKVKKLDMLYLASLSGAEVEVASPTP